jgi:uncharacterized protein
MKDETVAEVDRIWREAVAHVARGAFRSEIHGPEHWTRVERNGLFLCGCLPEADPVVVRMFAACHDAARENDGVDREHGPRAVELIEAWGPRLSSGQLDVLIEAVSLHTTVRHARDDSPTLQVCLDADRLDIARAGLIPDERYMSTRVGRTLVRDGRIPTLDHVEVAITRPELLRPTPWPQIPC